MANLWFLRRHWINFDRSSSQPEEERGLKRKQYPTNDLVLNPEHHSHLRDGGGSHGNSYRGGYVPPPSSSMEQLYTDSKVRVEFFTNEKSFKERLQLYFIKNQRSSLRIRIFNLFIKLLSCVLYIVRVGLDSPASTTIMPCSELEPLNGTNSSMGMVGGVAWHEIFWVNRAEWLWGVQVTVAIISLTETLLLTYLGYRGNILQQIISGSFLLEICITVPFVVTIFHPDWRGLFIPVFLNCWLAKSALENMLNDLHRAMQRSQSALAQRVLILTATIACLIFTSVCAIQHFQRGSIKRFSLFDSLWFVIVTFSTVGYGDIAPDIWITKLIMMLLIATIFIVLPTQFEQLAFTWMERQKQGGTYSSHRAQNEKHVVVVATVLHADTIMDFLNEFYAHPKLQDYYVVLMSPSELDQTMKMLLQVPIWAARVIYIQGSALKDSDLSRCRVQDAEACFLIAARSYTDRTAADQHTILRSWAVKDFAPHCPQYVQIFRPENKIHVKFAEHMVCEDEFKYALLANNCLCPAISTLVTLLLHTSRGTEGQTSNEEWMKLYGRCSGNEIYHIRLGESQFFGDYKGQSFTYASFHAHRKYGVALVGIKQDLPGSTIQLNPGPRHMMKDTDVCFYMSITKEENSGFILAHPNDDKDPGKSAGSGGNHPLKMTSTGSYSKIASTIASVGEQCGSVALELQHSQQHTPLMSQESLAPASNTLELPPGMTASSLQNKRPSIAPVPATLDITPLKIELDSNSESDSDMTDDVWDGEECYIKGFPKETPYIGTSPTLCHLLKAKRNNCCLNLVQSCEHCSYKNAREYQWKNRAIILAADYASNGLYNFIVPLRSHSRPKASLNPVVLLLTREPDQPFLDTMAYFPLVYYMIGTIESLDDLLKAGVNLADNVVIVNKESSNANLEDTLSDCNTIVAVQMIFRLFPTANIITELTQASNMRFMQFRAKDHYALSLSKLEKKEKERGSHLYYMFRLPFAGGNVFSASMLDTLLYQAFVKDYLITFVRLLLGVDQAVGSGHLQCMKITEADLWIRTFGRLYQKLCSTTCEIPIGVYRTQTQVASPGDTSSHEMPSVRRRLSLRRTRSSKRNAARSNGTHPLRHNDFSGSFSVDDDRHTTHHSERSEIIHNIRSRMTTLDMPQEEYGHGSDKRNSLSYVIINPSYDLKLEKDDIIYMIRPSSLSPKPSPLVEDRSFKRTASAKRSNSTRRRTGMTGTNPSVSSSEKPSKFYLRETETSPSTPTLVIERAISDDGENHHSTAAMTADSKPLSVTDNCSITASPDNQSTVVDLGLSGTVV